MLGLRALLLAGMVALALITVGVTTVLIHRGVDVQLEHMAAGELHVSAAQASRLHKRMDVPVNHLMLVAGGLAGLLGLVMALVLSLRMARPLERLTDVARRMEHGDLGARAEGCGGGREATELAHTLDRLATGLQNHAELRRATAADVTHELRGALVGLVGRIEILQDDDAEDRDAVLRAMAVDMARLRRLADDMDRLVDAQQPALMVERRPIDLAEVVRATAERHREACRTLSIALAVQTVSARVEGDRVRIGQVLDNLLANAIRYTDSGGRIDVRLECRGERAAVSVADTGIGIAPENISRVFDRFWRAPGAAARAPQGSGVGLAVVSDIVRAHGGRVHVASRPGLGTTFVVELALGDPAAAPRPVVPAGVPMALARAT